MLDWGNLQFASTVAAGGGRPWEVLLTTKPPYLPGIKTENLVYINSEQNGFLSFFPARYDVQVAPCPTAPLARQWHPPLPVS